MFAATPVWLIALGRLVHPPVYTVDHAAEQIGAPMRFGRGNLGRDNGGAHCD
jgi:hypothetical protein